MIFQEDGKEIPLKIRQHPGLLNALRGSLCHEVMNVKNLDAGKYFPQHRCFGGHATFCAQGQNILFSCVSWLLSFNSDFQGEWKVEFMVLKKMSFFFQNTKVNVRCRQVYPKLFSL